jgi:hypothetical protein
MVIGQTGLMTRGQILSEIRRTASQNGGVPLGYKGFAAATGIRRHEWYGTFWTKWSDAIREAGYAPNPFTIAVPEEQLLEHLAMLTRELGHYPGDADLKMKAQKLPGFPSRTTFRRLGRKAETASKLHAFSAARGYSDVVSLCESLLTSAGSPCEAEEATPPGRRVVGSVYLLKHGTRREFKIGRTNNPLRREGEVGVELPQSLAPIHVIETDDAAGIETYWHRRFAEKRLRGEWFAPLCQYG